MGRRAANSTKDDAAERMYFTEVHENAIIRYNASTDKDEREDLFRAHIAKALDKMAENIINRFKFPYINMTFEQTKAQVVSFLVCNLHKFQPDKGKAFSYFSVMAKRYLILHNNVGYKEERRSISLSDTGDTFVSLEEMVSLEAPDNHAHEDTKEFIELMIKYWDANLTKIFKKKRDIEIASAVIELFRRAGGIENFNKKALYIMIREMTDCQTGYITKVIKKMKTHAVRQMIEFHDQGTIDGESSKYFSYD